MLTFSGDSFTPKFKMAPENRKHSVILARVVVFGGYLS